MQFGSKRQIFCGSKRTPDPNTDRGPEVVYLDTFVKGTPAVKEFGNLKDV
jgi:hypothetical protein